MKNKIVTWFQDVGTFAAGMAFAGIFAGCVEGAYRGVNIVYAALFYGNFLALLGLGSGLLVRLWPAFIRRHSNGFFHGLAAGLALSAFALGYFYTFRDIFQEAGDKRLLALGIGAGIALTLAIMSLSLGYLWRYFRAGKDPLRLEMVFLGASALSLFSLAMLGGDDARCTPESARPLKGRGTIFLIVDTLRADVLGPYGAPEHRGKKASPNIDEFATQATTFSRFSAQASWTKPAMATLMTSRHVSGHNTMSKLSTLPDSLPLLATELQKAGVVTGAVVTNYNLEPGYGFARGFDHYKYLSPARYFGAPEKANRLALYNIFRLIRERYIPALRSSEYFYQSADVVNAEGLCILDEIGDKDFFLWLHYMEPHDPYFSVEGGSYARVQTPNPGMDDAEPFMLAYKDEVHRYDESFGRLMAALKERGLLDNITILLSSDHGEEFGEHGGFYHGVTLYEEQLHLPLIISRPNGEAMEDTVLARQIDVAPTVMDFYGLSVPDSWEGQSLFESERQESLAMAEENHQGNILRSIQKDGYKLILANTGNPRGLPEVELFHLAEDPKEQKNLKNRVKAAELEDALEKAEQDSAKGGSSGQERHMDAAMEAELRSLGYVQ